MKIKFFFGILIVVMLATHNIFAQGKVAGEQTLSMGAAKSIHQVELEKYKDFVPSEKTPEFKGRPMPLIPRSLPPSREIFGYLPYWTYPSFPNLNYDLLTTIAYFGAEVNEFGDIIDLNDWPAAALIEQAHSEGVKVVLTTILFSSSQLAALLSDPSRRANLVNNLLIAVQNANGDGVSIDFEGVPSGQRQNLTNFMTELATAFHTNLPGSSVTIFTPAVDWSNVFDYFALAQITDGLIMQGYDFHWSTAPTAAPPRR